MTKKPGIFRYSLKVLFIFLIYLFVLYLTSITVPSKTYSACYPRYYGEYSWQQQKCSWQNDPFFCRQKHHKEKTYCVLVWKILIKINKAPICIRLHNPHFTFRFTNFALNIPGAAFYCIWIYATIVSFLSL